jgi:hypothetical protein
MNRAILYDVLFDQTAELMQEAGFYVHTNNGRGAQFSTPAGMPVSIAEAMATGAYVLVREEYPSGVTRLA